MRVLSHLQQFRLIPCTFHPTHSTNAIGVDEFALFIHLSIQTHTLLPHQCNFCNFQRANDTCSVRQGVMVLSVLHFMYTTSYQPPVVQCLLVALAHSLQVNPLVTSDMAQWIPQIMGIFPLCCCAGIPETEYKRA